jgi:hypothetical protein
MPSFNFADTKIEVEKNQGGGRNFSRLLLYFDGMCTKNKKKIPPSLLNQKISLSLQKITRVPMRFNTKNLEVVLKKIERERERDATIY